MSRFLAPVVSVAMGMTVPFGLSAATWQTGDLTNELVVAKGETYTLTAEDAARLGETCLYLTGEGTVVGTKAFAAFTGDVRLSKGVFQLKELGGLGDTSTVRRVSSLVIDGGSLQNHVFRPNSWAVRDLPCVPVNMKVSLSGSGFEGKGVIDSRVQTENFARTITLADNAVVSSPDGREMQFRYSVLNKAATGLTLTVTNATFGIVQAWGGDWNGVDIDAKKGCLHLSDTTLPFDGSTFRFEDSRLVLYNFGGGENKVASAFGPDCLASLVFSGTSLIEVNNGCPVLDKKGDSLRNDRNRFAGAVMLNDPAVVKFGLRSEATGIAFDGVVSGAGGFAASPETIISNGWLRLSNKDNSFSGGVAVRGVPNDDGSLGGGLSLLASGAAPVEGGPITLDNAILRLNNPIHGERDYALPSLVVKDRGEVLDNLPALMNALTAKGLTKTGAGACVLAVPLAFSELADVQGGTLRLVPSSKTVGGLKRWWKTSTTDYAVTQKDENYLGLDPTLSMAYKPWTNYGSGKDGDPSYNQSHVYEGYLRIPGDVGEDVTFNFITCVTRYVCVWIDDTPVAKVTDNDEQRYLPGTVKIGNWQRLGIAPRVTMKAGWHRLRIHMSNSWNSLCGPCEAKVDGELVWPENFGIGVDWQGRCTTNTADYAKLDTPDGTLLRWTMDESRCRASFAGGVAFAAGTVFDLGDTAVEKTPLEVPSLAGSPTIRNGAVHVASNGWTLRAGDLAPGQPLTVEAGCSLGFGEKGSAVTVDVSPDALEMLHGKGAKFKILSWATAAERPDNAFVASDALKETRWLLSTAEDGVYLEKPRFMVIVR